MSLRSFIKAKRPRNGQEATAVFFYYGREYENTYEGNAEWLSSMFQRAGTLVNNPGVIPQTLRDAVNKYGFLARVEPGVYQLTPEGEEFVISELPPQDDEENEAEQCTWVGRLHARVIHDAGSLCDTRHFGNAVADAAKGLNNRVKDMAGRPVVKDKELDGKRLMMNVLSEDNPKIAINAGNTRSETSEREGFKFLCAGAWLAWRNPISHDETPDIPEIQAKEMLGLISQLHRCLDGATTA